ncbi:MAG: hypothetical protein OXH31_03445 [Gammaproteobacteria bacterium]|nr:hypothetical protein [Gammaproteobacteria bacterium]
MKLLIVLAVLISTTVFAQEARQDPSAKSDQGEKAAAKQPELVPLPKKGFSKSDCKGFFQHEELPFTVEIDFFEAKRTTINSPTDVVMELRYEGWVSNGKVKRPFSTKQKPTLHRAQNNSYGGHAQFYKTSLRNPFHFLRAYPDEDLSKILKNVTVVAKKEVITYDRGGSFSYETKRVKMQPIFMCLTFDLTKLENRKSSATTKAHAFFLAPHVDNLRKSLEPPPPAPTQTEEI